MMKTGFSGYSAIYQTLINCLFAISVYEGHRFLTKKSLLKIKLSNISIMLISKENYFEDTTMAMTAPLTQDACATVEAVLSLRNLTAL